ncbi:MAG: class I adenylate-forming enzyme family protein [Cyanobacteria bacterium P01_H01_bin.74]
MSLLFQHVFSGHAASTPVLIENETQWTFADFQQQVFGLCLVLKSLNVQRDSRVILLIPNQKEYLVAFFAMLQIGAVPVPVNITLSSLHLSYIVQDSQASHCLVADSLVPVLSECLSRLTCLVIGLTAPTEKTVEQNQEEKQRTELKEQKQANFLDYESLMTQALSSVNSDDCRQFFETSLASDPAYQYQNDANKKNPNKKASKSPILMYTSGTTALPKGVMLSERNLIANLDGLSGTLPVSEVDKLLLALPLFHAYGQIIALYALQQKATLILITAFLPKAILSALTVHQVSILPLVPTLFSVLIQVLSQNPALTFPALRYCISGGASLPSTLLRHVETRLNITVLEGYGLTETSPVIAVNRLETGSIAGSVGQVLQNVSVKISPIENDLLPLADQVSGHMGEICVKADSVMAGYLNLPQETALAFDESGYFRTGDLGHFDTNGNLYISAGRLKDLIIKAGENISPQQIETILMEHPQVAETAVVGIEDAVLGEDILACVTFYSAKPARISCSEQKKKVQESDLRAYCQAHLPNLMIPKHFWVLDTPLPRNALGKVVKADLKASWLKTRDQEMLVAKR